MKDWIDRLALEIANGFNPAMVGYSANVDRIAQMIREAYQRHQQSQMASACPDNAKHQRQAVVSNAQFGDAARRAGLPDGPSDQIPGSLAGYVAKPTGFTESGEPIFLGSELGLKSKPWVCFKQDGMNDLLPGRGLSDD